MIEQFLKDKDFIKLMQEHCYELISMLMASNTEFSIVAKTEFTEFDPLLPENLSVHKNPYALFALAGYTFESIELQKDKIKFHAGFGFDNFATYVSVDLGAITQIGVENDIIFVNFSNYERAKNEKELMQNSVNIFLKNPKNKAKFKK